MRRARAFADQYVVSQTGCWLWQLYIDSRGYGRVTAGGRRLLAHRYAYEINIGPIPDGLTVDHLCFTPACVNPRHLVLATHLENTKRQRSALKTHCSAGHEFSPANTYIRPESCNGARACRACNADAARRYQQRRSAA